MLYRPSRCGNTTVATWWCPDQYQCVSVSTTAWASVLPHVLTPHQGHLYTEQSLASVMPVHENCELSSPKQWPRPGSCFPDSVSWPKHQEQPAAAPHALHVVSVEQASSGATSGSAMAGCAGDGDAGNGRVTFAKSQCEGSVHVNSWMLCAPVRWG